MNELPYGLTAEDFARLSRAVRRSEGLPPRRDAQLRRNEGGIGAPHNWIKVTSATSQSITLTGGSVTGYPAVWSYFDSSGAGWTDTSNNVWFIGANGEAPTSGVRYECRCVGLDANGQAIFAAEIPSSSSFVGCLYISANSITLTNQTWTALVTTGLTLGPSGYDTGSFGSSITIPSSGYYAVKLCCVFTGTFPASPNNPYVLGFGTQDSNIPATSILSYLESWSANGVSPACQITYDAHYLAGDSIGTGYAIQCSGGNTIGAKLDLVCVHKIG